MTGSGASSGPPCGTPFSFVAQWRTTSFALGVSTPTGGVSRQGGRGPGPPEGHEGWEPEKASAAHRPAPAVPTQTLRSVPPAGIGRRGALRVAKGCPPRVAPDPYLKHKEPEDGRQGDGPEETPLTALGRGQTVGMTRVRPIALRVSPRRPQKPTAAQSSSWLLCVS